MSTLSVLTLILAVLGLVFSFRSSVVSAVLVYASVVCACFSGAGGEVVVSGNALLFWGVAAVIVVGLSLLNSSNPLLTNLSRAYAAAGAVVGSVLGLCVSHSAAAVILGSALGALLGTFAFTRTPSGALLRSARHAFTDYVCAAGLPAVVCSSMGLVAVAAVLF